MIKFLKSPSWLAIGVSGISLAVYLMTLSRSIGFIDAGELSAVAYTLGIAHPTGYPLFTLIGWIFARLPIASEEIVRLNMMAAIMCAAGAGVFFLGVREVLSRLPFTMKQKAPVDSESLTNVCAAGAALLLAFSSTYWSQSTNVEVYSLHVLLVSLILLTFVRAAFSADSDSRGSMRLWTTFAFLVGLGFTNHMTTVLLAPGLLVMFFMTQGVTRQSWILVLKMVPPFLFGLSVYLYLPIRSAEPPLLNWGNPAEWERLVWHLTGKQYRVWIFSSTEAAGRQLAYFVKDIPGEFAYLGLAVAVIGVARLFTLHRTIWLGTVLLFTGCVLYSINYDIHDIDSYFLLAYFCIALWAGVGIRVVMHRTWKIIARGGSSGMAVAFVPALISLGFHFNRADESSNFLVEDYTHNMFSSLAPNAVILSFQWDFWLSASYYYQMVKGTRQDLVVIDKELLRRSWYLAELKNRYPWLIEDSDREVEAFYQQLHRFEHDIPYDPADIQGRFVDMIRSFIARSAVRRPVYVTGEVEAEFTAGWNRIPEGLAFRLVQDSVLQISIVPEYRYRPFARSGRLEDTIRRLYSGSYVARARLAGLGGDTQEALKSLEKALKFDPANPEAISLLHAVSGRQ